MTLVFTRVVHVMAELSGQPSEPLSDGGSEDCACGGVTSSSRSLRSWPRFITTLPHGDRRRPGSGRGITRRTTRRRSGPTQSQLSRPMWSRHHISMEHRLRRKHLLLNPNTKAAKENKEKLKKKKEEQTKGEKKRKKGLKGVFIYALLPPRRAENLYLLKNVKRYRNEIEAQKKSDEKMKKMKMKKRNFFFSKMKNDEQ